VSDGGARRPRLPARKQALWGGTATGPTFDRLGIPAGTHVAAAGVSRGHRGRGHRPRAVGTCQKGPRMRLMEGIVTYATQW